MNTQKHRYLLTFGAGNYDDVIRILRAEADSLEFACKAVDGLFRDGTPFIDTPFTPPHIGDPQPVVDPGLVEVDMEYPGNAVVGSWIIADGVKVERNMDPT